MALCHPLSLMLLRCTLVIKKPNFLAMPKSKRGKAHNKKASVEKKSKDKKKKTKCDHSGHHVKPSLGRGPFVLECNECNVRVWEVDGNVTAKAPTTTKLKKKHGDKGLCDHWVAYNATLVNVPGKPDGRLAECEECACDLHISYYDMENGTEKDVLVQTCDQYHRARPHSVWLDGLKKAATITVKDGDDGEETKVTIDDAYLLKEYDSKPPHSIAAYTKKRNDEHNERVSVDLRHTAPELMGWRMSVIEEQTQVMARDIADFAKDLAAYHRKRGTAVKKMQEELKAVLTEAGDRVKSTGNSFHEVITTMVNEERDAKAVVPATSCVHEWVGMIDKMCKKCNIVFYAEEIDSSKEAFLARMKKEKKEFDDIVDASKKKEIVEKKEKKTTHFEFMISQLEYSTGEKCVVGERYAFYPNTFWRIKNDRLWYGPKKDDMFTNNLDGSDDGDEPVLISQTKTTTSDHCVFSVDAGIDATASPAIHVFDKSSEVKGAKTLDDDETEVDESE